MQGPLLRGGLRPDMGVQTHHQQGSPKARPVNNVRRPIPIVANNRIPSSVIVKKNAGMRG